MSDYKRFISYIYEYVQGEKRESLGFVKVNARDGRCKIQIHLRGFYTRGQKPCEAYIFTQKRVCPASRWESWKIKTARWNGAESRKRTI